MREIESVVSLEGYDDGYRIGYKEGVLEGCNRAWTLLNDLFRMPIAARYQIFGYREVSDIVSHMTYTEAQDKYKEWDKLRFHVGDTFINDASHKRGVITRITPETQACYVMYSDGEVGCESFDDITKTSVKIDMSEIFKEIQTDRD